MGFCTQCGAKLKEGNRFCEQCGNEVSSPLKCQTVPEQPKTPATSGRVGSKSTYVRLAMLAVMVMFFMPFFTISCNGMSLVEMSGFELAVGKEVMGERTDSNHIVLVALVLPALSLLSYTLTHNHGLNDAAGALSSAGSLAILLLTRHRILEEAKAVPATLKTEFAFYASVVIHAGVLAYLFYETSRKSAPAPVSSPVPLAPPAPPPVDKRVTQLLIDPEATSVFENMPKTVKLTISADGMSQDAEIHSFPCVLGRSPQDADVVLEDTSVSRKHAVIQYLNDEFVIVDSHSRNGLEVNGAVLTPDVPQKLCVGDLIKIGRVEIKVTGIEGA